MLTIDLPTARRFILGFWLEDDSLAADAAFADALARGFARFKAFLGAEKLDGSRINEPRLGKSVKGAGVRIGRRRKY